MSQLRAGADRVRVEVEIDGKTRVVELQAQPGEKIEFTMDVGVEDRELPPEDFSYRRFAPTGRMRIRLDAFGYKLVDDRTQAE